MSKGTTNSLNAGELREFLIEHVQKCAEARPSVFLKQHGIEEASGRRYVQTVQSWPVTKSVTVDDLVRTIGAVATREANGNGGLQEFGVYIYHANNRDQHTAKFSFKILADAIEDANGDHMVQEPANQRGFMAQLMRHKEEEHRLAHNDLSLSTGVLERHVMRLEARVAQLEGERVDMIRQLEDSLSQREQRELMRQESEAAIIMKKQAMDLLMLLGPTIVNRLAGKKLLPEKTDPRVEMLRSVMASLNEQQMANLEKVFSREQFMVIADMYLQFVAEEKRNTETQRKAAGLDKEDPNKAYQEKQHQQQAAAP